MQMNLDNAVMTCSACGGDVLLKLSVCPRCGANTASSSQFISFRYPNGGGGMVDQETARFLRSDLRNPSQAMIDELLSRSTRVQVNALVMRGKKGEFEPLFDVTAPADFTELRASLKIQEAGGHLMSFENRRLLFFAKEHLISSIGLIGAYVLRWSSQWKTDARIMDPDSLSAFLAARGHPEMRDQLIASRASAKRRASEAVKWQRTWDAATPLGLGPLVPSLQHEILVADAPSRRRAMELLKSYYPTELWRILVLFGWFGHASSPWSGFPSEEQVPECLLEMFADESILKAASGELTPEQTEGAARFLCRWVHPSRRKADRVDLPPDLRHRLWAHVQASGDADKIARAKRFLEPRWRP